MTRAASLAVSLLSLGLAACTSGVDRTTLRAAVDHHAVLLDPADAPATLARSWQGHRVVMLGETHYVAEHHALLGRLLVELAAERRVQVLLEGIHAYGWLVDDYAAGRREQLPARVADFQGAWLEPVRSYNEGRPEAERIVCANVDMNHGVDDFQNALALLGDELTPMTAFDPLRQLDPRGDEYTRELAAVGDRLRVQGAALRRQWGERRYQQLRDMLAVEQQSDAIRRQFEHAPREQLMIAQCRHRIDGWQGITVINCGMNHAQKRQRIYGHDPLLGTSLRRDIDGVFSVAFVPIRGQIKRRFFDPKTETVDVAALAPPADLVRILGEVAADRLGYLPMGDAVFTEPMWLHLAFESRLFAPFEAFDALVTYPRVSVLPALR